MKVDGIMLIDLLERSRELGTEDQAIALAREWIESAEAEIGRLRGEEATPVATTEDMDIVSMRVNGHEFSDLPLEIQTSKMPGHRATLWRGTIDELARAVIRT